METADQVAELTCSICYNTYTDPVSLNCRHSFCRSCIEHVLDYHLVYGEHSCPTCKKKFKEHPVLPSDTEILNAMQTYHAVQAEEHKEEDKVYCLYCTESQVPSVKTCVQCETPLCDQHLKAHNKGLNHILIPPTTIASLAYRKCSEHNYPLQYYCSQDAALICESCGRSENHWEHEIISVKDAFDNEKKNLHNFLCKLELKEEKTDSRMGSMLILKNTKREKTVNHITKMKDLFKEMRKQINSLQRSIKFFLYLQLKKISEETRRLQKQKETLSSKIAHVKELCNITDPVTLLLNVEADKDLLHDDSNEETEQTDDTLQYGIHESYFKKVSQLVSELFKLYNSSVSEDVNPDSNCIDL